MRGAPFLLLGVLAAGGAFGVAAGCSAEGQDIPVDFVEDAGRRRDVLAQGDDTDATGSINPEGGGTLDSGNTTPDSGEDLDSGTVDDSGTTDSGVGPCGFPSGSAGGDCTVATDIGAVSGDDDPNPNEITYTGSSSQWLFVTVTEDISGIGANALSVRGTLTSAPGTNYDLYMYVDPSASTTTHACGLPSGSSTEANTSIDQVDLTWPDRKLALSPSDTRLVSIEVRNVSGACGVGHEWSLKIKGHPL